MKRARLLPALVVSALFLVPAAAHAEEGYAGYGYEPTKGDHIGEKEYSPYTRRAWGPTPSSSA